MNKRDEIKLLNIFSSIRGYEYLATIDNKMSDIITQFNLDSGLLLSEEIKVRDIRDILEELRKIFIYDYTGRSALVAWFFLKTKLPVQDKRQTLTSFEYDMLEDCKVKNLIDEYNGTEDCFEFLRSMGFSSDECHILFRTRMIFYILYNEIESIYELYSVPEHLAYLSASQYFYLLHRIGLALGNHKMPTFSSMDKTISSFSIKKDKSHALDKKLSHYDNELKELENYLKECD